MRSDDWCDLSIGLARNNLLRELGVLMQPSLAIYDTVRSFLGEDKSNIELKFF